MTRFWNEWSDAQDPQTDAPATADLIDVDRHLRRDLFRARVSPPTDLRRRILRGMAASPRPQVAGRTRRVRPGASTALAALAAMLLLAAVLAPDAPTPTPTSPTPANVAAAPHPRLEPSSIVERLLKSAERPSTPALADPLLSEVRLIAQDARAATRFMLAHIPARYRPDGAAHDDRREAAEGTGQRIQQFD